MRKIRTKLRRPARAAALGALVAVSGLLVGCDDFMRVTNPGAIEPPALESPEYIGLMVNGVIGDFQPAFAWTALFSGVFADELRNHHAFFENPEIDRRAVNNNNGTYILAVYNGLHRARFLADSIAGRLQSIHADTAGRDLHVARVQTYSGYTWTLLGEQYCETPINRSAPVPSDQLLATAIQRFDAAIQVATAARAHAATIENAAARARLIAGADSILNFARVGAARAALNLTAYDASQRQRAIDYAAAVTPAYTATGSPGFEFWAHYARDGGAYTRRVSNPFWEFITSGRWFSVSETPFQSLDDPRVPHTDTMVVVADGTRRFVALSPSAFSTYDGSPEGQPFDAVSTIRVASALEARYVIAELEGLNVANVDFVNQRRAIGGQDPLVSPSEAEYMEALREQRSRDLYLDSHRLGDLRRYQRMYNVDLWPRGSYFGHATLTFGDQECWPIPLAEQF